MASRKETGSSSTAGLSSTGGTLDSPVKQIQIEGLVSAQSQLEGRDGDLLVVVYGK